MCYCHISREDWQLPPLPPVKRALAYPLYTPRALKRSSISTSQCPRTPRVQINQRIIHPVKKKCYHENWSLEQILLKKEADSGDSDAQFKIGELLFYGRGVAMDRKIAVQYMEKSCGQGNIKAQLTLGDILYNGWGTNRDRVQAAKLFQQAADKGDLEGIYNIALCYAQGAGVKKDICMAAEYLKKGADLGHAKCQGHYGRFLEMGTGVQASTDEAKKYYIMAVDKGFDAAKQWLDDMINKKKY